MKHIFSGGSVLTTGKDMIDALEALWNHRGNYDKACSFCIHEDVEADYDEFCGDCTISDYELSCSCHINPPCGKCEGSKFEVSPYLINYQACEGGKKRWQCFRGDKKTFDKLVEIEKTDLKLFAEILSTGEAAMYISLDLADAIDCAESEAIEICNRKDFKKTMTKMIMNFERG